MNPGVCIGCVSVFVTTSRRRKGVISAPRTLNGMRADYERHGQTPVCRVQSDTDHCTPALNRAHPLSGTTRFSLMVVVKNIGLNFQWNYEQFQVLMFQPTHPLIALISYIRKPRDARCACGWARHSFGARTDSLGTRGDHRGGGQVVVREVGFAPAGLLKEGGKRRQQPWELGLERRHIGRLGCVVSGGEVR